jgi:hypothetical protein
VFIDAASKAKAEIPPHVHEALARYLHGREAVADARRSRCLHVPAGRAPAEVVARRHAASRAPLTPEQPARSLASIGAPGAGEPKSTVEDPNGRRLSQPFSVDRESTV